jgi:hypothetical protein
MSILWFFDPRPERSVEIYMDLKLERQLLNADEFALVEKTHHPILGGLAEKELADLVKLLRERRDRAQQIAARQHREARGKADPKGRRAATENAGTREKKDLLADALHRLDEEINLRKARATLQSLIDNAARALALRRSSEPAPHAGHLATRPQKKGGQHWSRTGAPLRAPRDRGAMR